MKVLTIFLVIVVVAISGGLVIHYNQNAFHAQADLNQERYARMTAEENLEKTTSKIASLEAEVERVQNKMKSTERLMTQTAAANEDMKARLEKAARIKDELEGKLKELEKVSNEVPSNLPVANSQMNPAGGT